MERMAKKELEKLKDFKVYAFEGDVYVKAEDYKKIAIENKNLKENSLLGQATMEELNNRVTELEEENKKLNEFKEKREEVMFYFKALAERVEPINSKEAEELQKFKKLFEKLYREELHYLEEENKNLKSERDNCLKEVKLCYNDIHSLEGQISDLEKENKELKAELQEWLNAMRNK